MTRGCQSLPVPRLNVPAISTTENQTSFHSRDRPFLKKIFIPLNQTILTNTERQRATLNSFLLVGSSTHCVDRVTLSSRRQPNAVWRWRARRLRTHSALSIMVQTQTHPSFFHSLTSFRKSVSFICEFLWITSKGMNETEWP